MGLIGECDVADSRRHGDTMNIRTSTVELLRAGPRHNQLMSPQTQYLGVCDDSPASTVTIPYEHRELEMRLRDLSYGGTSADDATYRLILLEKTGQEIADILGRIPGVTGALTTRVEAANTLTQLRIVLSASELAMLPFELSKVPSGAGSPGTWLALQARTPICITRHIRSVSAEGMRWPTDPRILFIAGPDTPCDEHADALIQALAPWSDKSGPHERLCLVQHATLDDVVRAVALAASNQRPFTHVHVLAHGAPLNDTDRTSTIGVALYGQVVSGRGLATALAAVTDGGIHRPAVVTLAVCNSATITDVKTTIASVAHDLHDQGIPLVVASQFPLSVKGSIPFVARFYDGQLRGEHPLVSLYDVRLRLHSLLGDDVHDWASLVVYEAFPSDLTTRLEELRYWQARRAHDQAIRRLEAFSTDVGGRPPDSLVDTDLNTSPEALSGDCVETYRRHVVSATSWNDKLPTSGTYALECLLLQAGGHKRMGFSAFHIAIAPNRALDSSLTLLDDCSHFLEAARAEYWSATRASVPLSSPDQIHRKITLYWLLGQALSLDVVLGRPLNLTSWTMAQSDAASGTNSANDRERGWACVSLAELMLLRLADEHLSVAERATIAQQVFTNVAHFIELHGRKSEFVYVTAGAFQRFVNWWGNVHLEWAFKRLDIQGRPHWHTEHGLVPTAMTALGMMQLQPRPAISESVGRDSANRTSI